MTVRVHTQGLALVACLGSVLLAGCVGSDNTGPASTYAVSGTVGGPTAAGVTVSLTGDATASTTTDGNGTYSFSGLANGSYTLTPSKTGYAFSPPSIAVTVSGANVTGQGFTATAASGTHSISGTVSGATVAGVTVSLTGAATASATTDGTGTYSFSGLASGNYTLTPSKTGYTFSPPSIAATVSGANVAGQSFTATAVTVGAWLQGGCLVSALPATGANTVQLSPSFTCQTMEGIGAAANITMLHDLGPASGLNQLDGIMDDLQLAYFRLAPINYDFNGWENPQGTYPGKQGGSDFVNYYVPLVQYLHGRGISVTTGIWDVAAWVASGGTPSNPASLGQYLSSYTQWMGQQNAAMELVEIMNEPDNPQSNSNVNKYGNPSQLVSSAIATIGSLDGLGMSTMNLVGPETSMPSQTVSWVTPWCANSTLLQRTAAITYHTWWDDQTTPDVGVFTDIWNAARSCGKPVWATEVGYCAYNPVCPAGHHFQQDTWSTAWDDALAFYKALGFSHVSRAYYWMLYGWDGAVYVNPSSPTMIAGSDGGSLASTNHVNGERLPTYYILKHFSAFIPKGSVFIGSRTGNANVLALAFSRLDGKFSLILINKGASSATLTVNVNGKSAASVTKMFTSTDGNYYRAASPLPAASSVQLAASSVSSLEITAP